MIEDLKNIVLRLTKLHNEEKNPIICEKIRNEIMTLKTVIQMLELLAK